MDLNLYFVLLLSHSFGAELLRYLFQLSDDSIARTWRWRYSIFWSLFLLPYLMRGEFGYVIPPEILIGVAAFCIFLLGLLIEHHKYWLFTACALIVDTILNAIFLNHLGLTVALLFGLSIQCVVCIVTRRSGAK